ncbi:MAG: hypothetical protein QM786_01710 [Breznakibacter sp.]
MIYRLINKSTLLPFVLLPFVMVALWGKTLFLSDVAYTSHDLPMPFCDLLEPYMSNRPLTAGLVSLFIAFLVMVGLNRFNSRFTLLKRQSLVAGYVYLIFVSGFIAVQQLHPVWFFAPLFLLAIDQVVISASLKDSAVTSFNAAFLVTTGALFYGKALYFIPLVWWAMALMNVMRFRSFLASLLGIIVPVILTWGVYFLLGKEKALVNTAIENILSPVAFYDQSGLSNFYTGFLAFYILASIVVVMGKISTMKILNRKIYRVFIAIVTYGIVLAATPFFSMEIIPLIGIGASILLARFYEAVKPGIWSESIFALYVFFTLLLQWYPQ